MIDILAHRGQMAQIYGIGPIGMGHRMLWTPESLFLPLVNQTGDLAITADRIDNRDELIAALALTTSHPKKSRIVN